MALSRLHPVLVAAGAACFAAGFVSSHLVERSARAASESVTPSVYVPPDGNVDPGLARPLNPLDMRIK